MDEIPQVKISLCIIARDESATIAGCIKSFAGAVDEVIVVDTGSVDQTVTIAREAGAIVECSIWNNDFAEVRQKSFDLATGDFCIWADAHDFLRDGDAPKIRELARRKAADVVMLNWRVRDFVIERERFIRRGCGKWVGAIHEKFVAREGMKIGRCRDIEIRHLPANDSIPHARNIAMLQKKLTDAPYDLFYLATEYSATGKRDLVAPLARAAMSLGGLGPVETYELNIAMALSATTLEESLACALQAFAIMPWRREALVVCAQRALEYGLNDTALAYARAFMALPLPRQSVWTIQSNWYAWKATDLLCHILRLNGGDGEAGSIESRARNDKIPMFSLIHASRGRPKQMIAARDLWLSRADHPEMIEHVFSLDIDDNLDVLRAARGYPVTWNAPGGGCVAAWNKAAQKASGNVFIQLSDDWLPPQGWDTIILRRLGEKVNSEAVLRVSDGIDRGGGAITDCCCIAILTRRRWQCQGDMFFPGYKSVFSDNEFTDRAVEDGVLIDARDVVFEHLHPAGGKAPVDSTYVAQNAPERYRVGGELYEKRKASRGRGLAREYAALILATRDDFCLQETCKRLIEEGVKSLWFGVPTEFWNGKPCPREGLDEIKSVAARCIEHGALVSLNVLNVSKHRAKDRHILVTEALVRNELLAFMRRAGHDHVIVADGDELWRRGTLKFIDLYLSDYSVPSLTLGMIPVAGLPGYPIEGAQDAAMVYVGPGTEFSQCRSAAGSQTMLPRNSIIHFTATRKTMQEIIEKHRQSGHYTDPMYPMEDWIEKTLPHIKPGMKRAHMFTEWDVWPLVREWTTSEISEIPISIHPYLGISK